MFFVKKGKSKNPKFFKKNEKKITKMYCGNKFTYENENLFIIGQRKKINTHKNNEKNKSM